MSTEATYYQELVGIPQVSGRAYPIKLPQNPTYPAVIYNVEVEIEGRLSIDSADGLYAFENIFYATSYSDIIAITESFRDISISKGWNIVGYTDLDYVEDKQVYARALIINVLGTI